MQEAAYTSLLEDRRRELHRVVGTTLEELDPNELSEAYGLLAHHFAEADEPKRAARYLLEAGNAARALYADEEAIAHYRRALSFLDRLGDTRTARSVLFKIALAHHSAFDFEAADASWAEAFTRPEPQATQLERTERLETAGLLPRSWVPGHGYEILSWAFGPNLFRGLLRFERGTDVVPDLAENVSVSADGCTYVFRLHEGLLWSDGEPLTARDFAFTYQVMREQAVNTAHFLEGIDAEARDALTLELRLSEPRAHMLYLFAQFPLFPWPQHKVEALGAEWYQAPPLVGNGPFVLAEAGDERVVLAANALWAGSHGNVRELTLAVSDPHERLQEWTAGRFDFVYGPSRDRSGESGETLVIPVAHMGVEYLGFSAQAPFDDVRVRKSLAHALDRAPFVEGSANVPAYGGFLPPAMPGHSHDIAPEYNIERGRTLLTEAGYADGRGLPELRLIHPDPGHGPAFRADIEARWASQWHELGVRVRQEWVVFEQVDEEAKVGPSFWTWGWVSDYPDPQGMLGSFLESQPELVPHDDELSQLLERARSLRARDERLELYRAADRQLVAESAWAVPIFYDSWEIVRRPYVEGLWAHLMGISPLEGVVVRQPT